jgi:hypothetical protein
VYQFSVGNLLSSYISAADVPSHQPSGPE